MLHDGLRYPQTAFNKTLPKPPLNLLPSHGESGTGEREPASDQLFPSFVCIILQAYQKYKLSPVPLDEQEEEKEIGSL
jgi:hypothetical protein